MRKKEHRGSSEVRGNLTAVMLEWLSERCFGITGGGGEGSAWARALQAGNIVRVQVAAGQSPADPGCEGQPGQAARASQGTSGGVTFILEKSSPLEAF